jgi:hypothetical protein
MDSRLRNTGVDCNPKRRVVKRVTSSHFPAFLNLNVWKWRQPNIRMFMQVPFYGALALIVIFAVGLFALR